MYEIWYFLACIMSILFPPFSGERRQARSQRGVPNTRDGGRHRKEIIFFVCLSPSRVSGIVNCFVLALANPKNAKH